MGSHDSLDLNPGRGPEADVAAEPNPVACEWERASARAVELVREFNQDPAGSAEVQRNGIPPDRGDEAEELEPIASRGRVVVCPESGGPVRDEHGKVRSWMDCTEAERQAVEAEADAAGWEAIDRANRSRDEAFQRSGRSRLRVRVSRRRKSPGSRSPRPRATPARRDGSSRDGPDLGDGEPEPRPPPGGFPLNFVDRALFLRRGRALRCRFREWRER
jgi:hypothetical protein